MYNRQNKALASHPENHRLVLKPCKSSKKFKKYLNIQILSERKLLPSKVLGSYVIYFMMAVLFYHEGF